MVAHLHSPLQLASASPVDRHPGRDISQKQSATCQICFEASPTCFALCGPVCPAAVCHGCLETHITTSLRATLPGILPRMRCPVCLTRLAKPAWQSHVAAETTELFESLCAKACEFPAPCCHEANYTQLQRAPGDEPPPPFESFVDVRLYLELPLLCARLAQFERYELAPRQLVHYLDELVDPIGYTPLLLQEFLDNVARYLHDDERRGALVLAFHNVHRRVITRCCFAELCFCCKRKWDLNHEENPRGPCDVVELTDSDVLQCRACRVMLVKVEGCDAVQCPCGFAMSWSDELQLREDQMTGLIPTNVDPLDVEHFQLWDAWRRQLIYVVRYELPVVRDAWRRRELDLAMVPHRVALRRMLQTRLWWRRFQYALPDMAREIHKVRLSWLERRLRRLEFGLGAMVRMRLLARIRRRSCLNQIKRSVPAYEEEEIDDVELRITLGLFDDFEITK